MGWFEAVIGGLGGGGCLALVLSKASLGTAFGPLTAPRPVNPGLHGPSSPHLALTGLTRPALLKLSTNTPSARLSPLTSRKPTRSLVPHVPHPRQLHRRRQLPRHLAHQRARHPLRRKARPRARRPGRRVVLRAAQLVVTLRISHGIACLKPRLKR